MNTASEVKTFMEKRLRLYEDAIRYRRTGMMPPIGFPIPNGDYHTWECIVKELELIIDNI